VHSDHWFHAVFRALPDLVRQLIPALECSGAAAYSFRPIVLKKLAHSPDGVLWPDQHPGGSPELDPSMALFTLPVQKEQDLGPCTRRILAARPDLIELILPILSERFQGLSPPQIMATLGISKDFWRHTRAFQYILEEGREDGRREIRSLALRHLERRCGPIGTDTRGRLETLNLEQIEALALDLLDFQGAADLHAWLERNGRPG
jgi:hypothetical protein